MGKIKHGLRHHRIYIVWRNMKRRCNNPSDKRYSRYGERGIKICDEWVDKEKGLINFYSWAIKNGYGEDLTLDRINNDGNYEPKNCRWTTCKEQSRNRSTNKFITYKGQTKLLSEWANELKIERRTLAFRLKKGWSIKDAFTIKPRIGNNQNIRRK